MTSTGPGHVEEAIETIAELERQAQADISPHQLWMERVTHRLGRPRVVYFIVSFVAMWILVNLALGTSQRAFDPPPFSYLQGMISLSALLMAVLILTTENRTAQIDQLRNRLDLQINLLTERKSAKLIAMLDDLRRDLPQIPTHYDPEVRDMSERIDPQAVARSIEERTPAEPGKH